MVTNLARCRRPLPAQFDYLKSLEIEEKINKIRWCKQGANSNKFLLSTNDKTIKLWKARDSRPPRAARRLALPSLAQYLPAQQPAAAAPPPPAPAPRAPP